MKTKVLSKQVQDNVLEYTGIETGLDSALLSLTQVQLQSE